MGIIGSMASGEGGCWLLLDFGDVARGNSWMKGVAAFGLRRLRGDDTEVSFVPCSEMNGASAAQRRDLPKGAIIHVAEVYTI